jgi:queuosine biosynthesis protein QueD
MYLAKDFYFEAAHHLTNYEGKCKNIHGHSYRLRVTIKGKPENNGMIMDFSDLKKIVNDNIVGVFDHTDLNEHLDQPTAENLCIYIWEALKSDLPLYEVKLWETRDSSAFIRSEDEN